MNHYAQFYQMSTGYVSGSTPPTFEPANSKPIEACGSESIYRLDGRWSLDRKVYEAHKRVEKINTGLGKAYVGFDIRKGETILTRLILI